MRTARVFPNVSPNRRNGLGRGIRCKMESVEANRLRDLLVGYARLCQQATVFHIDIKNLGPLSSGDNDSAKCRQSPSTKTSSRPSSCRRHVVGIAPPHNFRDVLSRL